MSRAEVLERRPSRPSKRVHADARRAAWEPDARDREIVRLRDEEGWTVARIAAEVGVSGQRVSYLYLRYKIRMGERHGGGEDQG